MEVTVLLPLPDPAPLEQRRATDTIPSVMVSRVPIPPALPRASTGASPWNRSRQRTPDGLPDLGPNVSPPPRTYGGPRRANRPSPRQVHNSLRVHGPLSAEPLVSWIREGFQQHAEVEASWKARQSWRAATRPPGLGPELGYTARPLGQRDSRLDDTLFWAMAMRNSGTNRPQRMTSSTGIRRTDGSANPGHWWLSRYKVQDPTEPVGPTVVLGLIHWWCP